MFVHKRALVIVITYAHTVNFAVNVHNVTQNNHYRFWYVRIVYKFQIFWWNRYTWNFIVLAFCLSDEMFTCSFRFLNVLFKIAFVIWFASFVPTFKIFLIVVANDEEHFLIQLYVAFNFTKFNLVAFNFYSNHFHRFVSCRNNYFGRNSNYS